jgi:hypothetical protein
MKINNLSIHIFFLFLFIFLFNREYILSQKSDDLIYPFQYKDGKWGYNGYKDNSIWEKTIIQPHYDEAYYFYNDIALVKLNNKYGYIDKSGKEIIPFKYEDAFDFCEGFGLVKFNDKYGFVNKSGKEVISIIYDDANDFSENYALVKQNNKYGYINKLGNIVIPIIYDKAYDFKDGYGVILFDKTKYCVDKDGISNEFSHSILNLAGLEIFDYRINNQTIEINSDEDDTIKIDINKFNGKETGQHLNWDKIVNNLNYPIDAKILGLVGDINMEILIGKSGKILKMRNYTGNTIFCDEVIKCLKKLEATPQIYKNEPYEIWFPFRMRFRPSGDKYSKFYKKKKENYHFYK